MLSAGVLGFPRTFHEVIEFALLELIARIFPAAEASHLPVLCDLWPRRNRKRRLPTRAGRFASLLLHLGLGKVAAILDEVVPTRDAQRVVRLAFDEDHVVGLDLERHKTRDYI